MPLQNHFGPPLNRTHPWRGFHSAWAAAMARYLNQGVLPAGYYAIPNVDLDGPVEIDVAALRDQQAEAGASAEESSALWTPSEPGLKVMLDFPPLELVEVQVFYDESGPQLKAAIELVSRATRTGPRHGGSLRLSASVICTPAATWSWSISSPTAGRIFTPRSSACWN